MSTLMSVIIIASILVQNGLFDQENGATTLQHSTQSPVIRLTHGAQRPQGLPVCKHPYSVCSIVHNRFWVLPVVVRFCQCPYNKDCPDDWNDTDDHTMALNSRAQMKFCAEVTALPPCGSSAQTAVRWEEQRHKSQVQAIVNESLTAECYCPKYRYYDKVETNYVPFPNNTSTHTERYVCKPLRKCRSGQLCGYITADMYQTYFICACPQHHMCLFKSRERKRVRELMYDGQAYKGICKNADDTS